MSPRRAPTDKLVFYFQPDKDYTTLQWMACQTVIPGPCNPPCSECIVCEACHECRPYDVVRPTGLLAHGSGISINAIADICLPLGMLPGVNLPDHLSPLILYGLKESEVIGGLRENQSIEKLTGRRGITGPYVLLGISWMDCERKYKARDVTEKDLEALKAFLKVATPNEALLQKKAKAESQKKGSTEMSDMLDAALGRR